MWHRNKHRHFSSKLQKQRHKENACTTQFSRPYDTRKHLRFFRKIGLGRGKLRHWNLFAFPSRLFTCHSSKHTKCFSRTGALCGRQTMMPFIPVKYWDPQLEVPLGKYVNPGWSQTMRRLTRIRLFVNIHTHTPEPPSNRLLILFILCQRISLNGFYFKQFHSPAFPYLKFTLAARSERFTFIKSF